MRILVFKWKSIGFNLSLFSRSVFFVSKKTVRSFGGFDFVNGKRCNNTQQKCKKWFCCMECERAQVTTINRCAVEKTVAGKNSDGTKKSKQTEKKTMNESIVIGCWETSNKKHSILIIYLVLNELSRFSIGIASSCAASKMASKNKIFHFFCSKNLVCLWNVCKGLSFQNKKQKAWKKFMITKMKQTEQNSFEMNKIVEMNGF